MKFLKERSHQKIILVLCLAVCAVSLLALFCSKKSTGSDGNGGAQKYSCDQSQVMLCYESTSQSLMQTQCVTDSVKATGCDDSTAISKCVCSDKTLYYYRGFGVPADSIYCRGKGVFTRLRP